MTDLKSIVEGCKVNNSKCQEMLYERYFGFALKTVFRYVYRYEKAIDVTNDGFVKLFRNFHRFHCNNDGDLEKVLMGWIRRIMINSSIDELRRKNMIPEIGGVPEYAWDKTDRSNNADQLVLYKDLVLLIKKLPSACRAVFNMFVIDGMSHHEISVQLNISVGTSKSNLSKARLLLRKYVKDSEENEEWRT